VLSSLDCIRQHASAYVSIRQHASSDEDASCRGIMTWKTGGRYDGEYVDDKMTGCGMMTWADGRRYEVSNATQKHSRVSHLTFCTVFRATGSRAVVQLLLANLSCC
jgi:hypothetical protein